MKTTSHAVCAALAMVCVATVSFHAAGDDIRYSLAAPANVTIVVEDANGGRVRNLIADAPRVAGAHAESWDGRDDFGNPMPAGEYHWRGIAHGAITANWLGAFYSPGSTPWRTHTRPGGWNLRASGAGGWLSDHTAPWCLFSDSRHVYVGAKTAEAGDAIVQCDLDGRKLWGTLWLGLSGAHAICTEGDTLFVAGEGFWMGKRLGVNIFDVKGYKWIRLPKEVYARHIMHDSALVRENSEDFSGIVGMYLTAEHIVVALSDKNRLSFFDRRTGLWHHDEPMSNAEALVRRPSTKIFHGRATDADGNLYVCDTNREEQCVKVFSPSGKLVRRIGRRGGRREGRYDPLAMGNPVDVTVDARGNVWVCENTFLPKRVSVWTREGALVRDYVGTPFYGGGGSIDSTGRFAYYGGMRFRLKEGFAGAELDAVLYDPSAHPEVPSVPPRNPEMGHAGPSTVREWRGRTYLVADDGPVLRQTFIGEIVGDRLVPRVVVGSEWEVDAKGHRRQTGVFLWQDGVKTFSDKFAYGAEWSMRLGPDMEIVMRTKDGKSLAVFKPVPGEVLRYDFAKVRLVHLPPELAKVCSLSMAPDGRSFIVNRGGCGNQGATNNLFGAVSLSGRTLWTYPNPYPSNTHNSPLPRVGELRHTLGIEGFSSVAPGGLMLLNGNKGTRYLFTVDGLFVMELFGDMRTHPATQNLAAAERGMVFSENSLCDECFYGWFGDVAGRPHLIEGKDSLNICELRGAETIARLDGGALHLAASPPPLSTVPRSERGPARTVKAGGFGLTHDWWKMVPCSFPEVDPVARFSIGWNENRLTLHYDVDDPTPFENAGEAQHTLFHSGDALDFRWEGDPKADPKRRAPVSGDQRLVIAPIGGKPVVVRYVFVDPAAKTPPVEFVSPAGRVSVARVETVKDAKVEVKRRKGGYAARIDIPWKSLGEKVPFSGGIRRADAGVIFGDAAGARAMRRQYLFDPGSQEVSDIPSEVKTDPSKWGTFSF
jgi:hypothetical protein